MTDPGGWAITSIFSNNLTDFADDCITGATWEIRQGIMPGDGGKLIASGMTMTPQVSCGSQLFFGYPECGVTVAGLYVYARARQLPPERDSDRQPPGSLLCRDHQRRRRGRLAPGQ